MTKYRRLATPQTEFPNLYVIGAAKSGTTSLINMLGQHGAVFFPREKEPHYFFISEDNREWMIWDHDKFVQLRDTLPYGNQTAYLSLYHGIKEPIKGDGSTQYLVNSRAAQAVQHHRPDANIVVMLRSPVERCYSAFLHAKSRGEEPAATFQEAVNAGLRGDRNLNFATNYVYESCYAARLKPWLRLFGSQVLVIFFEDFRSDPIATCNLIAKHVGIRSFNSDNILMDHRNQSIDLPPRWRVGRVMAKRIRRAAPSIVDRPIFRRPFELLLRIVGSNPPHLDPAMGSLLYSKLAADIAELEQVTGRTVPKHWHKFANGA